VPAARPDGEHQDGDDALTPNRLADLETVAAGQHDVQHHQIDPFAPHDAQRFLAIGGEFDGVALGFEDATHHAEDARIVVHDKHLRCLSWVLGAGC
jgi:hypothetical protein